MAGERSAHGSAENGLSDAAHSVCVAPCIIAFLLLVFGFLVGLQELESAFRASRRADAFMAIEKKGKAAFVRVRMKRWWCGG